MRFSLKRKNISFALSLLISILFFCVFPATSQLISTPTKNNLQNPNQAPIEDKQDENNKITLEPPEVILNDQKVIFNRKPILDNEVWLFPLEEISEKLQDRVITDLVNGTITIQRYRDKSIVQLNIRNGIVTINNRPFKILFGYNRIITGADSQMVPTSALVMLLGLTSKDNEEGKLILNNTIGSGSNTVGTVQPLTRKGVKDLLVDYLTVTNSFDWLKSQSLSTRRTEINSGFHNDNYAITSDFLIKAGTDTPLINFDTGNVSYYKNASPLQIHVGDKPLSLIKSPLLGGITLRGIQLQTSGPLKNSKFVFGGGFLPTNGKVLGSNLSFVKYGRLAEVAEWSTSPNKPWQFSIGEATYNDLITNSLVKSKQSGGLFALSLTKTGKYLEGNSNLAFGVSNDKTTGKPGQGPGGDILVRLKPKDWISFFSKGAYYSPGFYTLSGNPFYHDRNEATFGLNITPPRSNIGISHSIGKFNLNSQKPNDYSVTNVFASATPFKKGPTILTSYSKNDSQISSTREIDNVLFPINMTNISIVDLETLIERRTNSFFRASIMKNWKTVNFSSSVNYFTFADNKPLKLALIGGQTATKFLTYDLNINKSFNKLFGLQSYIQGSKLYKQVKFGINLGPVLNNKLNLLLQTGVLLPQNESPSSLYSLNLNYQANKKTQLSLNYNKTKFLTSISGIYQYNLRGNNASGLPEIGEAQTIGRIKGQVIVLEANPRKPSEQNKIILPGTTRERGMENVRIHLGNYTITTSKDGTFEFPSLTPGVHRVRIEYSDLPSYLTSITPEAVDIKVEGGKETNFDFILAYFGSLSGKLQLANEPIMKLEEEPELQDIRVYLEGTDLETLTNIDGSFVLGDVKPGKYKLKVDPDFLPKELEIDPKDIEIEVRGKEKIDDLNLPIRYRTRPEEIKVF